MISPIICSDWQYRTASCDHLCSRKMFDVRRKMSDGFFAFLLILNKV